MLQGRRRRLVADPELVYVGAMCHDLGLTDKFHKKDRRTKDRRFEVDGAEVARDLLTAHGASPDAVRRVWTAIALHTTPGVPEFMEPEIALVTAGVDAQRGEPARLTEAVHDLTGSQVMVKACRDR